MNRDVTNDADFRREVCDWLCANDLDPATIPMSAQVIVANGWITVDRKLHRNAGDVVCPTGTYGVLTETVTVPLLVAPEGDVAEWVRPRPPHVRPVNARLAE